MDIFPPRFAQSHVESRDTAGNIIYYKIVTKLSQFRVGNIDYLWYNEEAKGERGIADKSLAYD